MKPNKINIFISTSLSVFNLQISEQREMKTILSMKMLLLVLLVSSLTEGRIMSKCDLKAKLEGARFQDIKFMGEKLSGKDLVARRELLFLQIPVFLSQSSGGYISMSHVAMRFITFIHMFFFFFLF